MAGITDRAVVDYTYAQRLSLRKIIKLKFPSDKFMVTDGVWPFFFRYRRANDNQALFNSLELPHKARRRHSNKLNVLFADGHAGSSFFPRSEQVEFTEP